MLGDQKRTIETALNLTTDTGASRHRGSPVSGLNYFRLGDRRMKHSKTRPRDSQQPWEISRSK